MAWTVLFGVVIFLGAFLLFQVQPLIARYILPWFGGSASVWSTTLLFFQTALLAGYAYAHLVASRLRPRTQVMVHVGVAILALAVLPIVPSDAYKPDGAENPTVAILILLAVTVGLPYLVLAATGPLMQAWFSRARPDRSPYRLYALSNAASLLGLVSYPLIVERYLSLRHQALLWSGAFVAFVLATVAVGRRTFTRGEPFAGPGPGEGPIGDDMPPTAGGWTRGLWVALPATAVVILLAVTNQMTLEVAQIPLLWVPPLTAYLLSFVVTFAKPSWYRRGVNGVLLVVAMALVVRTLVYDTGSLVTQVSVYTVGVLVMSMSLHGELVRLRPPPAQLTGFYLLIATGGALGGAFVALLAPRIFPGLWELHIGLLATAALVGASWRREARRRGEPAAEDGEPEPRPASRLAPLIAFAGWAALLAGSVLMARLLVTDILTEAEDVLAVDRGFYGVLRVAYDYPADPQRHTLSMLHGPIEHGLQFVSAERADWPTTYYSPRSGVGIALRQLRAEAESDPDGDGTLAVGVVGLGVGTIAAYAREGDVVVFYEIDPVVVDLSARYFTFVSRAEDRGADVDVLLGDARLVMERQIAEGDAPRFDVLVLDAFSADAIPVHLLTREAFAVYGRLLAEHGTIAVHVSNLHLDLAPVVRKLAEINGKQAVLITNAYDEGSGAFGADWILVTDDEVLLASDLVVGAADEWDERDREPLLWTDDHSNLLAILD